MPRSAMPHAVSLAKESHAQGFRTLLRRCPSPQRLNPAQSPTESIWPRPRKCQDCHTPRTKAGELNTSKWFKGEMLDFQPSRETGDWGKLAPDLTSSGDLFARRHERGMVEFLETGAGPAAIPRALLCRPTNSGRTMPKPSSRT